MVLKNYSSEYIFYLAVPLVGDLDGDSIPEIVVPNVQTGANSTGILVFDNQLQLKHQFSTGGLGNYFGHPYSLGDVDGDGLGEILVATGSSDLYKLRCYTIDGTLKWVSNNGGVDISYWATAKTVITGTAFTPVIADMDSDGKVEILCGDRIFDGNTGLLLATLPSGTTPGGYEYGRGYRNQTTGEGGSAYMAVLADIDGDGKMEVVAGNTTYRVNINRINPALSTATVLAYVEQLDGMTSVADIDGDGILDVLVSQKLQATGSGGGTIAGATVYCWQGSSSTMIGEPITTGGTFGSRVFVGDINNDKKPEICFTTASRMWSYAYDKSTDSFNSLWIDKTTSDGSGATTMTLFDFNLDGEVELVYRDQTHIRILDKDGNNKVRFDCFSATHTEYPVVVDLDGDGHAEIIVSGALPEESTTTQIRLQVFSSSTTGAWTSARKVWNQHGYNAAYINEDLSIPQYPVNPAMSFPGADGISGTSDDIHPYNNFLQQQTLLDMNGLPTWITPDAAPVSAISSLTYTDSIVNITLGITNLGDAAIGPHVYFTLYKNDTLGAVLKIDSANIAIQPGETRIVTTSYVDASALNNPYVVAIRVNDRNRKFAYFAECDSLNNVLKLGIMTKTATLNGVQNIGRYANPVSVLGNEKIKYEIRAVNANEAPATITITDTLPPYLEYAGEALPAVIGHSIAGTPPRYVMEWELHNVSPFADTIVSFLATPENGVSASQPFYINNAWTLVNGINTPTNNTYHQGAGVAVVTFSATLGGNIYNADEQALDYKSSPRNGILVVPDDGFRFAGWSHDEYVSLRGEVIPADSGIIHCDTLTIYGNVELRAVFEPDDDSEINKPIEEITKPSLIEEKIWSAENTLYVRTIKSNSIVRIYRPDGVLYDQRTIITDGTTTIPLPQGIYIVTINNGIGQKVR
jgi:hypothetical protein